MKRLNNWAGNDFKEKPKRGKETRTEKTKLSKRK